jgi:hypothetical protein
LRDPKEFYKEVETVKKTNLVMAKDYNIPEIDKSLENNLFFDGKLVYFSTLVRIDDRLRKNLVERIEFFGGSCFWARCEGYKERQGDDEEICRKQLTESDVIVCAKRGGWEFWQVS